MSDRPAILGGVPIRPQGPPEWPRDDESVRVALQKLIDSRDWGRYHGPHVPELCRQLSKYHGVEHVHPCSSGTSAVELALRGAGVDADDEVILAGYDFKANFQNVLMLRATPVLIDLDARTWQLDPSKLEAAITPRTRAILVSHLHGGIVSMPDVLQIAKSHDLVVIEDACQSPGAMILGRRAGTWGDVGVLSFGGSKLLTAGRGGSVLTSRTDIAERIKRYVNRGNDAYPLSEMQAAILLPQLKQLDTLNEHRRTFVSNLSLRLRDLTGLSPLQLPTDQLLPTYYKVGFRYCGDEFGNLTRDSFVQAMRAEGIAFDAGFRSLHRIHAARRFRTADSLDEASRADEEMLTLHHPVLLENDSAVEEIEAAIRRLHKWSAEIAAHAPAPVSNNVTIPS